MLDACVASAIDVFTSTLDTSTIDYASVNSEINSLASGLTSYGVTTSVPALNPATSTGASSYSGPYVSDIISSYSEYTKTHTGTGGSVFSFETNKFTLTPSSSSGMFSHLNEHQVLIRSAETTNTITSAPISPESTSTTSAPTAPVSAGGPRKQSSELWTTLLLGGFLGVVMILL